MTVTLDRDKFRGVIIGAAVGDAMGMPYQFLHPQVVRDTFHHPREAFQCAPETHVNASLEKGQYTDETQLMTIVIDAIIEKNDIDPTTIAAAMLRLFNENAWITPGRSILTACRHLAKGMPWHEAGGYRDGSKPLAFIPPIVLHRLGSIHQAADQATTLARIILVEPRALNACRCFAFLLRCFLSCRNERCLTAAVGETAEFMAPYDPAFPEMLRWVLSLLDQDTDAGLQEIGTGYSVLESLFASLFAFLKHPQDFGQAVSQVVFAGDSADTTGFLTGAFSGAFLGFQGIPEHMVAGLKDSQFFLDLADRFYSLSSPAS